MRPSTARRLLAALLLAAACGDSPSGPEPADLIAFAAAVDQSFHVYVIGSDGAGLLRVDTLESAFDPTWSPDGRTLAFAGNHRGVNGLFTARPDGSEQRLLRAGPASDPIWHPDGRRILYLERDPQGTPARIVSVDTRGGDRRVLFPDGPYDQIALSRDGARIAWSTRSRGICVAPLRGGAATCPPVQGDFPSWSPDGRVAFSGFVQESGNRDIYLMDPDGRNVTRFTRGPESDWGIAWSPGGERVVVERDRDRADQGFGLDIADASGGVFRPLTPPTLPSLRPAWRPRGR